MKFHALKKASSVLLTGLVLFILSGSLFGQNMFRKVNDFDGDGKADYAVTRNVGGQKYWYVWKSASGPDVFQWGLATDLETAGDWDGDGKTDYSVYRYVSECIPNNCSRDFHQFWFYSSQANIVDGRNLDTPRLANTTPIPQDYNGDGKMDAALIINNTPAEYPFPLIRHLNYASLVEKSFNYGDVPQRVGDLTGDGKSDIVSISSGNVVITKNYATDATQSMQFGAAGDQYIPADFDGDGKGDIAVFRESNGTWWWLRSSDNVVNAVQFGLSGDKPVPADYDGDGKTDLAIWRPGTTQAQYWVYGSMGNIWAVEFGVPTDTVVRY